MKKNCAAFLLFAGCLCGAACAQQQPSTLAVHAAQCLASKKQLPISSAKPLSYGSWIDTTSYPGKKVLYLAATSQSNRFAGRVYAIFFRGTPHRRLFDIQNGATFVKDANGQINFVVPPLGAAAAEPSFVNAINQIEGQPTFTISGAELAVRPAHTVCKSYIDNDQP
ncbi:MAG: hypothetical protein ACRD28_02670 [Acidobacteriaceae bacterium]